MSKLLTFLTVMIGGLALPLLSSAATPLPKRGGKPADVPPFPHFNRDIRPLLVENCFTCHGPDQNKRAGGFRLDVREEPVARGAIVPGDPKKSSLIQRINTSNEALRMPPAASRKRLTPQQKILLERWIRGGAKYERHWSLTPLPASVNIPEIKNAVWAKNEIDRFVLARLQREKIAPSPEVDRATWLRRVTLDLTGLLPSPRDLSDFLADRTPQAHARVVDRLLASPRFGERMAVPWLDLARYADSYGYQSDQLSPTWPYRDWVVRAFNANLPYNQFLTQQLAGDLLPHPTRDQRLATAFNRLHRMTNEGGSVPEEWRLEGVADRIQTFGTAFLGLTVECARCHDHKFDPITQRDYYSLAAFFNSIDEYGLYDRADIVPTPSLLLPTPAQEQAASEAREAVSDGERRLAAVQKDREGDFQSWLSSPSLPTAPDMVGRFDFEAFDGTALKNQAPGVTKGGVRQEEMKLVAGRAGNAALFDGENGISFPDLPKFTRYTPFTFAFWLKDARAVDGAAVVLQGCAGTDAGPHGYDLLIEKGRLTARLFRHWPGNAIAVRTRLEVPKDTWTHIAFTYDGSSRATGLRLYLNGRATSTETVRDHLYKGIGEQSLTLGQRFRDIGFKGGQIDDLEIYSRGLTPVEVSHQYNGRSLSSALNQPQRYEAVLRDYYFSAIDSEVREANRSLAMARRRLVEAEDAQMETAVMEEMPRPRTTYLLARGRYDASVTEADRVSRGTPAALPPFLPGLPKNRLGLAQWLTRPDHPLTARVAVNRVWALLFGRGLVETVEDFGIQGSPPSHPELLDWLAREFVRSGWNSKALVKRIVLSGTYRQASSLRPDLRDRDPQNILLARGPSHRLSAEVIRDIALQAGGLLDERQGGPPVSPYQPGDLWTESNSMSPPYRQSIGGDLYRRSLYTVWKRTSPMPNVTAFDAPSREVCVARRPNTNTPMQALILLNDVQFVEAARCLAERTLKDAEPTDEKRARFVFRQLAVREPTPAELRILVSLYREQRANFRRDPQSADRLLGVGGRKPDASLSPIELAAATVLAQAVLNLDATIWKR